MGSKSQPAPPPPVDPSRVIQAQADVNRIDQFTPLGDLTFGGPNRREATLDLDPQVLANLQAQLGLDTGLLGAAQSAVPGIQGLVNQPLSTQGLPNVPTDFNAFNEDISQQFFDRSSSLLDEQFGLDEERLRQRLANQGLQTGGEAFDTELGLFNQRRGETFGNLARDATLFGGQEASRALQAQAGLRNTAFGERGAVRGNQFNELAALLGLQQVQPPGLQNFFGPSSVNAVDPFALQAQGLQNNFNTISNNNAATKGAGADLLGTLGGAFIGTR